MGAQYSFVTRWRVPASAERCWSELERALRGDVEWWPGVEVAEPAVRVEPGARVAMRVRSPLGYRLRAALEITRVDPGRSIEAASAGHLRGAGRVEIDETADCADVWFHWDVETTRRWMNATAPVLRPLFTAAHARVMARGERGLRAAVAVAR
ncbi:MAG: hypothetical protein QM611_03405 [Microbacterium sp.]|uniref:hypothetical protein n=1 Tax=Microbacterium sp. TaxID=51671 RepID=UPI0039E670B9